MRAWARRTSELHGELSALARLDAPVAWWLLAGGAAAVEPLQPRSDYVVADAVPSSDTFIGVRSSPPADPIREAIAHAHAARAAIRVLDGQLPDQPLAVTIRSANGSGARTIASALDVAAFAIGDQLVLARLADDISAETTLAARIARGESDPTLAAPFVCVSIGDEPIETARHGHRRAWHDGGGPWLGIGRAGDLSIVSTCHLAVDGYGHAWLASKLAALLPDLAARSPEGSVLELPPLPAVGDGIPLGIAWRELPYPAPRALQLGYALGRALHRAAGDPHARFSPTFQIPVARGDRSDPLRRRRRVVASALSLRFEHGEPEPFEAFEARARTILDREAAGHGLISRLLRAARAAPLSLAWKRNTMSTARPRWLDRLAEVVGGRGCLSKIRLDVPLAPACAVSSPARLATPTDPLGACVVTVLDDGSRAAITVCGSGLAGTHADANALIDELLALL